MIVMKKSLIAAIGLTVSLLCVSCQQKQEETAEIPTLYCVKLHGSWGYMNPQGDTVIPLKFASATPFAKNGLAMVQEEEKGPYGFINTKGKYAIKPQYAQAYPFSDEGVAIVVKEGGVPTLINSSGKKVRVMKDVYKIEPFFEGLAAFSIRKKRDNYFEVWWGYMDTKGEVVIEPQFRGAYPFSEGLANVLIEGGEAYINTSGEKVFELKPEEEEGERMAGSNFHDGMARVFLRQQELYGFLNRKGEIAVPTKFQYVGFFNEGLAAVVENNLFGYIDKEGNYVIQPRFTGAGMFVDGLALVRNENDRWGFIDREGNWVIPAYYEAGTDFHNGVAAVQKFRGWGLINREGEYEVQPDFFKIQFEWEYEDDDFLINESMIRR